MPILDWLNKDKAVTTAQQVPYRLLEPVAELSAGDENSGNMLIQGDNLEALKSLLPLYGGKVKCIYIDPPYNTKSAFEHYDDNLEHSVWLSMMYPRLELLRELLSEDGSIWVNLDDNESHYLKVIMDEVFGRKHFVSNVIWQKKYTVANDAKWLSDNHDHILCYSKNKEIWRPFRLPRRAEMDKRYKNPDKHPKGAWKSTPLYAKRLGSEKEQSFSFTFKNGYTWKPPYGASPRFPTAKLKIMDENDEIWFGVKGDASPSRKTFLSELKISGTPAPTIWPHNDVGHNHEAREEVKAIDAEDSFSTPKPERLLQRIIELASRENDLILDSFLGSGTAAAVAHKMNRRYIGIEMGGHAVTHCQPRLQKVIAGEQGGISKALNWQGGGGFTYYRLGEQVFDKAGHIRDGVSFTAFAQYLWFLETGTPLTTKPTTAFLGEYNGKGYYLLYNGILGDRRPQGGNVLTSPILANLPPFDGSKVIFGESSRLGGARLAREHISFRQIPYEVSSR